MAKELVKAATLTLDYEMYPRHKLNDGNVSQMIEARRAGVKLPPVIVARKVGRKKKDGRVVDGFHRTNCELRLNPEADIEVEYRDYANEGEMFEDAVRLNATHGYRITKWDQTRIVHTGAALGVPIERLAADLCVPVETLEKRAAHIGVIASPSKKQAAGIVPLKRTFRHLEGKKLTPAQVQANDHATGHPQSFLLGQVISILESGAVDFDTPLVVARLHELRDLLYDLDIPEMGAEAVGS